MLAQIHVAIPFYQSYANFVKAKLEISLHEKDIKVFLGGVPT